MMMLMVCIIHLGEPVQLHLFSKELRELTVDAVIIIAIIIIMKLTLREMMRPQRMKDPYMLLLLGHRDE